MWLEICENHIIGFPKFDSHINQLTAFTRVLLVTNGGI